MDRAQILRALLPDHSVESDSLGGVRLRPAPASLIAILIVEDEGFAEALDGPARAVSSDEFLTSIATDMRPTFERLIEACVSEPDRKKALSLRHERFIGLALECFVLSLPLPVQDLFPSRRSSRPSGHSVEDDPSEIAIDIFKTIDRLSAVRPDAHLMSWTRLRFAEAIEAERDRDELSRIAVGSRVSQADQKGWKKFIEDLGR